MPPARESEGPRPNQEDQGFAWHTGGDGRLLGRVALVSGGAGGIGRAIVELFVAEGASVLVGDLDESDSKQLSERLAPKVESVVLDVRDPEQWHAAIEASRARFGAPPNVLVHAAGVMVSGAAESATESDMRLAFDVNVLGVLYGIQAVVPGMRAAGSGSIVAITSMGGVTFGVANLTPYCASKAAATAVATCAALELGHSGIRVNSIIPGQVDTPMSRSTGSSASAEFFASLPIPRVGQPLDIARAALFLASNESSWITGTKLVVDGGMDAGPGLR
jgi:3alpha(or 20beta)-hydroxysteroid dehydrogenase